MKIEVTKNQPESGVGSGDLVRPSIAHSELALYLNANIRSALLPFCIFFHQAIYRLELARRRFRISLCLFFYERQLVKEISRQRRLGILKNEFLECLNLRKYVHGVMWPNDRTEPRRDGGTP